MASISLLIPAWNESQTISMAVLENYLFLIHLVEKDQISEFEILVLNDGSEDKTSEVLDQLTGKIPQLRVISNNYPTGIYSAFNLLYANARMDWVLLIPGDYQWRVDATKILLSSFIDSGSQKAVSGIRTNKDLVYGSSRLFVSNCLRLFADWILKAKNSDPGSIKIVPNLASSNNYLSKSVLIEIERLLFAKTLTQAEILYVAVPWNPRISGVASGVSRKTLQPVMRDLCLLSCSKILGRFSSKTLPIS